MFVYTYMGTNIADSNRRQGGGHVGENQAEIKDIELNLQKMLISLLMSFWLIYFAFRTFFYTPIKF